MNPKRYQNTRHIKQSKLQSQHFDSLRKSVQLLSSELQLNRKRLINGNIGQEYEHGYFACGT